MSRVVSKRKVDTNTMLLEAAKKVLRKDGFSGLSTRGVATVANVPLSQIHYHFGSKEGLVLALFEYLNAQLLDRQHAMFNNPDLRLSEQWELACSYLDEDLASGYVRVLQELWAAGYSNPHIAKVVRDGLLAWQRLLTKVVREAEGGFGPDPAFEPEELAALVGATFIGSEAYILLGVEKPGVPIRESLRKVGRLIRKLETNGASSQDKEKSAATLKR